MSEIYGIVDDLRILESTNTQVRRISVISAFVKTIGRRQVPSEILKKELIEWSKSEEWNNPNYKKSTGKLTDGEIVTGAFGRYIHLLSGLGLIKKIGHTISLTSSGKYFLNPLKFYQYTENNSQYIRLLYLDLLLRKDADTILCVEEILKSQNEPINQATVQNQFKSFILHRLKQKLSSASSHIKSKIAERRRIIQLEWKEPETYAEHFIAPRLEWMCELGLFKKHYKGSNTLYELSDEGSEFFDSFPMLENSDIYEFNNKWYNESFFKTCSNLLKYNNGVNLLENKDQKKITKRIGGLLLNAIDLVESSSSFTLPIRNTIFYISASMLILHKTVVEFDNLKEELIKGVSYGNKVFGIKTSARINEGYITIKLK